MEVYFIVDDHMLKIEGDKVLMMKKTKAGKNVDYMVYFNNTFYIYLSGICYIQEGENKIEENIKEYLETKLIV